MSGPKLLSEIITALSEGIIDWPEEKAIIDRRNWNRLIKMDSSYYTKVSTSSQEMFQHEWILLNLASKYLKKKIVMVPFLEGKEDFQIGCKSLTSYNLLCCVNAHYFGFFFSIFPQ